MKNDLTYFFSVKYGSCIDTEYLFSYFAFMSTAPFDLKRGNKEIILVPCDGRKSIYGLFMEN